MLNIEQVQEAVHKIQVIDELRTGKGDKSLSISIDLETGDVKWIVDAAMRSGGVRRATVDGDEYLTVEEAIDCYNRIHI